MEEKKNNKKVMIVAISILTLVTLSLLGLTYAYYQTRIVGNANSTSVSVTSEKLEVTYGENSSTVVGGSAIAPGSTFTKTFTVKNTGDGTANYGIKIENIVNTFARVEDWTYTLKKGTTTLKENVELPTNESYLINSTSISAGTTQSYTLTVKYENSNENQSVDMGKSLSFKVNIANEAGEMFADASTNTLLYAIGQNTSIGEPLTVPGQEVSAYLSDYYIPVNSYTSQTSTQSSYYITYADNYTFDNETGKYTLVNPKVGLYSSVYSSLPGKYVVSAYGSTSSSVANSTDLTYIYKIKSATSSNSLSYTTMVRSYKTIEKAFASTEDDYGTSYYFRGNPNNNYVNYEGMCWRIVRVQGDGHVKLILADENNECDSTNYSLENTTSAFINDATDYAYDSSGNSIDYDSSNIPAIIEDWISDKFNNTS